MADKILYVKSAFKHGYTQTDIERAIETKIYEDTQKINDETIKVFHAMELREKIVAQMDTEG